MTEMPEIKAMNFETALRELETIVERLESGKIDLEQSIAIWARCNTLPRSAIQGGTHDQFCLWYTSSSIGLHGVINIILGINCILTGWIDI